MLEVLLIQALPFFRATTVIVFTVSFAAKIANVARFKRAIEDFSLLPTGFSSLAAPLFLLIEVSIVILLLVGNDSLVAGFLLAIVTLILFSAALFSVVLRRLRVSCNCFGASDRQVTIVDVWRNAIFLAVAALGLAASELPSADAHVSMFAYASYGVWAVFFFVVVMSVGELSELLTGVGR